MSRVGTVQSETAVQNFLSHQEERRDGTDESLLSVIELARKVYRYGLGYVYIIAYTPSVKPSTRKARKSRDASQKVRTFILIRCSNHPVLPRHDRTKHQLRERSPKKLQPRQLARYLCDSASLPTHSVSSHLRGFIR